MDADLKSVHDLTNICESLLREKKYAEAIKKIYDAKRGFDEVFGDYRKAKNILDSTKVIIKDAEGLNIDLSEVKGSYSQVTFNESPAFTKVAFRYMFSTDSSVPSPLLQLLKVLSNVSAGPSPQSPPHCSLQVWTL